MEPKKPKKALNNALKLSGAGMQMGLTIFACNWLGKYLDTHYDKTFWETTLTLLGIFASMYLIIRQVLQITKDND